VQRDRLGPGPSADAGPLPGFDATPPTQQTQPDWQAEQPQRAIGSYDPINSISIELMSGAELLRADRHVPGGFRVVQGGGLDDLKRERAAPLNLPGDRGAEHGPIKSARSYCVNPYHTQCLFSALSALKYTSTECQMLYLLSAFKC